MTGVRTPAHDYPMTYTAANGHKMIVVSTHTDKDGREVPDHWNAHHSPTCPCLKSEDW